VTSSGTRSDWSSLLRIACALIRQVNSAGPVIDHWTLGGGTALMLRIEHRESRDIDIFLPDPQQLGFLDPTKHDFDFETRPSGHIGDGAKFLKLAFANLGEIDFIVAGALTPVAETRTTVEGEAVSLETVPEIITKKIYYRGSGMKPRDIFDIAASGVTHADSIIPELRKYKNSVSSAIAALETLNPDFINRTISQLAIMPRYEAIAKTAGERTKEILRAV
jgi:hypothetical protein